MPLWKRIAFSLLVLVGFFVLVELACAAVGAWVLSTRKPDLPESTVGKNPARVEVPRDESLPVVVCVGDSWTFGTGLEPHEAYPAQLEEILREDYQVETQVVNLGMPGNSLIKITRFLDYYLRENPADVILLLGGTNADATGIVEVEGPGPLRLNRLRPFLHHSRTYRLMTQLLARAELRTDALIFNKKYQHYAYKLKQEKLSAQEMARFWDVHRRAVIAGVSRLDNMAMAWGIPLVLCTYSYPPALEGQPWNHQARVNQWLWEAAAARGLPVLDFAAAFRERGVGGEVLLHGEQGLLPDSLDLHPNADGYRIFAEEAAALLADRLR